MRRRVRIAGIAEEHKNEAGMPNKKPTLDHLKRQLWKLATATFSMQAVLEYLDLLRKHSPPPETPFYQGLMTAIAVEYARPFSADSRSKLGHLSSKFARFDSAELREMHDELMAARQNHYAHFSFGDQDVYLAFRNEHGKENWSTHITVGRCDTHIAPVNLDRIQVLAMHQKERLGLECDSMVKRIFDGKRIPPGVYRVNLAEGTDLLIVRGREVSERPQWFLKPDA